MCHPDYAAFSTLGANPCDVQVRMAEELNIEPNSTRAIVVPYYVPDGTGLYLSDDDPVTLLNVTGGHYQLLYQTRRLTNEEISASTRYTEEQFDPSIDGD